MNEIKEADITINGTQLTLAQSMTVRVAMQSFASFLIDEGLGKDERGKLMAKAYISRINEINSLIAKNFQ